MHKEHLFCQIAANHITDVLKYQMKMITLRHTICIESKKMPPSDFYRILYFFILFHSVVLLMPNSAAVFPLLNLHFSKALRILAASFF